jgi:HPt (histidine-containing phosphotransfer) domain-containing protein
MRKIQNLKAEIPLDGLEVYYLEFLGSREAELTDLKQALVETDFTSILGLGHKWKGYSAPYGFGQLAILAAELEEAALSHSIEQCKALTQEIAEYLSFKKNPT